MTEVKIKLFASIDEDVLLTAETMAHGEISEVLDSGRAVVLKYDRWLLADGEESQRQQRAHTTESRERARARQTLLLASSL